MGANILIQTWIMSETPAFQVPAKAETPTLRVGLQYDAHDRDAPPQPERSQQRPNRASEQLK